MHPSVSKAPGRTAVLEGLCNVRVFSLKDRAKLPCRSKESTCERDDEIIWGMRAVPPSERGRRWVCKEECISPVSSSCCSHGTRDRA